jgi:hypothetical protein
MSTKDAASVRVTDPPTEAEIGQVLIALAAFPTLHGIVRRLAFQRDQMATPAAPAPASEPTGELPTCAGCGLPELHKMCPAHGTPIYMDSSHPAWGNREAIKANAELSRLRAELDPPVCRLQFPDGSVPGNAREAAEGWKRVADELRQRLERAEGALREALSAIDEAYEATGYFKVAKDSVQRQKIVAALADKGATDAE